MSDTFDRPFTPDSFISFVEQGSTDWFALRCGKVTASRMGDVMAKPREPGKGLRANYRWQLVTERLTGIPAKTYQSKTMAEAHEWEPLARAAYSFLTGHEVRQVGFVEHPSIPMCGCSPDGLVDPDGGVEIKCPELTAHYETLLNSTVPAEYLKQVQFSMGVTGRAWWDYVSFNADLPEKLRTVIIKVPRSEALISEMEVQVRALQTEIDFSLSALKERFGE